MYVLTVPAIWNEKAKKFMREAAVQAGITSSQVVIALEQEAASIYCQTVAQSSTYDVDLDELSEPFTRYIVVDAGGGTVDTTVYEVRSNGKLKEIHRASGGGWGGTNVDDQFTDLLLSIFTPKVIQEFGKNHHTDRLELENEFEMAKRRVSANNKKPSSFEIPVSLLEIFSTHHESLQHHIRETKFAADIRFVGNKMRVSSTVMRSLFQSTCQKIVDHVTSLLADPKCSGVSHILLVGGFGESPYLQEMFQREFSYLNIVTPPDAELSVMKGGVIFGHSPETMMSRVCSFIYGISVWAPFVHGKHDPEKLCMCDGQEMCADIFSSFVSVGEEVGFGKESDEHRYCPVYQDQTRMRLAVYRSTVLNPVYTTDPSCTHVGEFKVLMPDLTGGKERTVEVKFVYGGTELTVVTLEETTNETFKAVFDFCRD